MPVSVHRAPQNHRITALHRQIDRRAEWQQHFGRNMAERQAGENRRCDLTAQPIDHGGEFEAFVVPADEFVIGELTHQHSLLPTQDAGVQKLRQHALNPVWVLANVFQEQNAAFDGRELRRSQQAAEYRQVAAPQTPRCLPALKPGL